MIICRMGDRSGVGRVGCSPTEMSPDERRSINTHRRIPASIPRPRLGVGLSAERAGWGRYSLVLTDSGLPHGLNIGGRAAWCTSP